MQTKHIVQQKNPSQKNLKANLSFKVFVAAILMSTILSCSSSTVKKPAISETIHSDPGTKVKKTEIVEANNGDSILGKWVDVGRDDWDVFVHVIDKEKGETYIKVDKKENGYILTASNLDESMPGIEVYKLDSIEKAFAGTILNAYEYTAIAKNVKDGKIVNVSFTPLHQSMQNAVWINGWFAPQYHQFFMNEKQNENYYTREAK